MCGSGSTCISHLAPGLVAQFRDDVARSIGGETGASQMIGEHVIKCTILPHGNALSATVVVFGDDAACLFIVVANEVGGDRACPEPIEGLTVTLTCLPAAISTQVYFVGTQNSVRRFLLEILSSQ